MTKPVDLEWSCFHLSLVLPGLGGRRRDGGLKGNQEVRGRG